MFVSFSFYIGMPLFYSLHLCPLKILDACLIGLSNSIDCIILLKVCSFLSNFFRSINESKELKLQLDYKQLALGN